VNPVQVGASATVSLTVSQADTAISLGSGDVPVLGTPRVLALMEQAAIRAIEGSLDEALTSVGLSAELTHSAATLVGGLVRAEARVTAFDGRTIDFSVTVSDVRSGQEVARGTHRRVVVNYSRFMNRLGSSTLR
jgi:fluoroacetyl-CoA thioesterase